jgi:hypothetical protein
MTLAMASPPVPQLTPREHPRGAALALQDTIGTSQNDLEMCTRGRLSMRSTSCAFTRNARCSCTVELRR